MSASRAGVGRALAAGGLRDLLRGAAGLLAAAPGGAARAPGVVRAGDGCALAVEHAPPDPAMLHDDDRRLADAFPARRREQFLLGRAAANRALAALDGPGAGAVGRGPAGAPRWPAGWTGSISHGGPTAVAVVLPDHAGPIGIDVEPVRARDVAELVAHVLSADEHARLAAACGEPALAFHVGFSTKEAVVKALLPLAPPPREFREVALDDVRGDGPAGVACRWRHAGFAGVAHCVAAGDVVCALAVHGAARRRGAPDDDPPPGR